MFPGCSSKSVLLVCRSDVKIVLSLHRNKKYDVTSLQRPTMTNSTTTDHGQAEMTPLRPTWGLVPRTVVIARWGKIPQASGYNFGGNEGVYGPQNTPMLWRCIITGTWSALMAIHPLTPHKIIIACLGVAAHPYNALLRGLRPHLVQKGAISAGVGHGCGGFCVCFVASGAWTTFSGWTMGHIGYHWKALVSSKMILALYWCRDVELKEKRRKCADFLHWLIILDFWLF